jgi:TRAP-type C4-dicarboxylate transport system permease small subunit
MMAASVDTIKNIIFMKTVRRLDDALALMEKGIIVFCFWLLVALVLFTILSRNIFHLPSHQVFEASPRLVLWLALFGATLALKQQRHIRLELVLRHAGDRVRHWTAVVVNGFGAATMAVLLTASFEFVGNEVAMFGGWGWLALIFPVFFGLAAFRYLTHVLYRLETGPHADSAPRVGKTR